MFQLIFVFLISVSKQCQSQVDNQSYFITQNELLKVNLSTLFVGSNISYSVNESEIKFALPIYEQFPKTELPFDISYVSFKAFHNQQRWLNQFAFMNSGAYYIEIAFTDFSLQTPLFENLVIIDKQENELICFDFDYYNHDSFILDCNFLDQNHLFVFKNSGERLFIIEIENNFTSQSRKIRNYNQQFYVLQHSKTESVLDVYLWNEEKTILSEQLQFNTQQIRQLLQNDTISLNIKGFFICSQHTIYFFDQSLGVFKWTDHLEFEEGKIISFYCDELSHFKVYLYRDKIIIEGIIQKTIHHNITLGKDAEIQISGQYLVLHNKGQFYTYSIYSGSLLQQFETEGILTYISSDNKLITLSNSYAHLYFLSHGYLLLTAASKEITNFIVKGLDSTTCSVQINIQSIKSTENQNLYQLNTKIPSIASTPSHPVSLPILASGPNQKYSCLLNCQITQQKDIQMTINQNSILYLDFKDVDSLTYYILYQMQNFTLMINKCQLDERLNCLQQQLTLKEQITKSSFQWIYHQNQIYLIYIENKSTLKIATLTQTIHVLKFDKEILSFYMDQNLYVIIQEQLLCYLDILNSSLNNVTVDQKYLVNLGYNNTWNPTTVSMDFNKQFLFIVNEDQLLITNQIPNFSIKGAINILQNIEIAITSSPYTFIIVQDNKIMQYYYDLELYHELQNYQLINPINLISTTHHFLIQSASNEILIYKFNSQAHDALKLVLPIQNLLSIPQEQLLFAASEMYNSDLLLLLNHQSLILKQIFNNPQIQFINQEFLYQDTYKETEILLSIANEDQSIQIEQKIKLLNTQTGIAILEKELREDNQLYLEKNQQKISLQKKWYQGHALNFAIKPEVAGDVTITNLLEQTSNTFDNTQKINNFIKQKILQGTSSFIVLDKQQLLQIVNLDINLEFTCIQTVSNEDFYFTLCNSEKESQIHVARVTDGFALGLQIKLEQQTKKIEVLGSNLIVLSAHSVKLYKLTFEETFQLNEEISFNADYVKYDGILLATDFELTNTQNNEYCLQILTINGIIVILRGQFIDDQYQPYSKVWYDVKQLIAEKILDTTQFIVIKHLFFYSNLIPNIRVLLLTDNSGSYGVRFEYNDKLRVHLDFQIFHYGFWKAIYCQIEEDLFAIQYTYGDKALIGLYQIQYKQMHDSFEQYTIITGIQQNGILPPFFFIFEKVIYVQDQEQFIQYHLNEYIEINVKGGLDRQHLNISSYNDFGIVAKDFIINYNIKNEKQYIAQFRSNAWWIVLICVIAGALIIAFAFYFYKRAHPVKSVSSILLE